MSLSDPGSVERHRERIRRILADGVDVLFSNEAEILGLTGSAGFDAAVRAVRGLAPVAALTRGARGAVVVHGGETWEQPAEDVPDIIDTTGAGDLFATGFLEGLLSGRPLAEAARMGNAAAAEVIACLGARPEADLEAAFAARGL